MTLILTSLTDNHVIQASDRRLVWFASGGRIVRKDDERCKAVVWRSRLVFGYTGLAELGYDERRTDLWLAKALNSLDTEGEERGQEWVLEKLAERTTEQFRRPPIMKLHPSLRRHAFVAAGWAKFTASDAPDTFRPYLAIVSNFHDSDGNELSDPCDTFTVGHWRLDEGFGWVESTPSHLDKPAVRALTDRLANAGGDPFVISLVLAEEIRRIAEMQAHAGMAQTVGRRLLISVIPRSVVERGGEDHTVLFGRPSPDSITCLYVPEDTDQGVAYGPILVSGGGAMMILDAKVTWDAGS